MATSYLFLRLLDHPLLEVTAPLFPFRFREEFQGNENCHRMPVPKAGLTNHPVISREKKADVAILLLSLQINQPQTGHYPSFLEELLDSKRIVALNYEINQLALNENYSADFLVRNEFLNAGISQSKLLRFFLGDSPIGGDLSAEFAVYLDDQSEGISD